MTTTRTFHVTEKALAAADMRPGIGNAIEWAEGQVDPEEWSIIDVSATPLGKRWANAWEVEFTVEAVEVKTVEVPTHPVAIRGGHSLYCTQCDYDVARLNGCDTVTVFGSAHDREVFALLRRDLTVIRSCDPTCECKR